MTEQELDELFARKRESFAPMPPVDHLVADFFCRLEVSDKPQPNIVVVFIRKWRQPLLSLVAASVLLITFFWHRSVVLAEKARTDEALFLAEEAAQRARIAQQHVEELRRAGYLDPVNWHGPEDRTGRKILFLTAGYDELFVGGMLEQGVISRVEVDWGDQPGMPPEVIYPNPQDAFPARKLGRATFSGRHKYTKMDGRVIRPRVRAIPYDDAKPALMSLGFSEEKLSGEGAIRCSPLGLVADTRVSSPQYEAAVFVLSHQGSVVLFKGGEIEDINDLPIRPSIQRVEFRLNRQIKDSDFLELRQKIGGLQGLGASATGLTDEGMKAIGSFPDMRWLYLSTTLVSDSGMEHIKHLRKLLSLSLASTKVTDRGLQSLRGMTEMGWLSLQGTAASDVSLDVLKGLKKLKFLNIKMTAISAEGVRQLRQALPDCVIES